MRLLDQGTFKDLPYIFSCTGCWKPVSLPAGESPEAVGHMCFDCWDACMEDFDRRNNIGVPGIVGTVLVLYILALLFIFWVASMKPVDVQPYKVESVAALEFAEGHGAVCKRVGKDWYCDDR